MRAFGPRATQANPRRPINMINSFIITGQPGSPSPEHTPLTSNVAPTLGPEAGLGRAWRGSGTRSPTVRQQGRQGRQAQFSGTRRMPPLPNLAVPWLCPSQGVVLRSRGTGSQ